MSTSISFPVSPSVGQEYTYSGIIYKWDGDNWYVLNAEHAMQTQVTFEALDSNGDIGSGASQVPPGNDSRFTPTFSTLGTDLTSKVAVAASDINWALGVHFTKTLTGNLTLTFSNLVECKTISFTATGDFTLALPAYVNVIEGTYDGTVDNLIQFYCEESSGGSEVVWCVISQETV